MTLLLGLDLGTSSVKAVLFDPQSTQTVAVAAQEYPIQRPTPDRAEQDPAAWWAAMVAVTQRVLAQAGRYHVAAVSFSGQMHGTVLLDTYGHPIHPAIIWADGRSADACAQLVAPFGPARYAAITGTLPAPGFLGATLRWLAEHEPDLLARTRQVVLPKDYIRLRLTGEVATEVSDAAGSGVFDVARGRWAEEILAAAGLPHSLFPPVLVSTAVAGQLTASAADALGLLPGLPVIAGCADQPAQAIGNGLIAPGAASVTVGSGGQVFVPLGPAADGAQFLRTDPRLHVFNHAVPGMWYVLGAILSAGLALRWLRQVTGLAGEPDAYARLSAEAAAVAPGADGLLFLPYLSGERTPHMDPRARGAFIGLSAYHGRGHLARAVMEGVALALRQVLEISLALAGPVEQLIAAGGGAESGVWGQILADVLGRPLRQSLLAEQAGVGAALLAGVGAGVYPDLAAACHQVVQLGPTTEPDLARQATYDDLYARFLGLYPRLRTDLHGLARPTP